MDPLATPADLVDRNISLDGPGSVSTMLAVASSAVRGAAGSPISRTTSTITYTGWRYDRYLKLFGPPVVSVSAVEWDGEAVEGWRFVADGRLWRRCGWGVDDGPTNVDVTQTHGLLVVSPEIVDLVCSYTAAGLLAAADGYENHAGKVAERIDDYSVTWAQGAEAVASAMEIPPGTRTWLSSMFGGSAAVVPGRS